MWGKEGLELAGGVQSGRRQEARVDAHGDLMHDARRVGEAIGGLKDGARGARGGQQVGHGRSWNQRTRGGVGQEGGLGVGVAPEVGVGACRVVGAAVGQGERVPMQGGGDVGLGSAVGEVAIPFLVAGSSEMLDLPEAYGLLLRLECRRDHLWPVQKGSGVMLLTPRTASCFGLAQRVCVARCVAGGSVVVVVLHPHWRHSSGAHWRLAGLRLRGDAGDTWLTVLVAVGDVAALSERTVAVGV